MLSNDKGIYPYSDSLTKIRNEFELYDFIIKDRIDKLENFKKDFYLELEKIEQSLLITKAKKKKFFVLLYIFHINIIIFSLTSLSCQIVFNKKTNSQNGINNICIMILISLMLILSVNIALRMIAN
jgi:hypothetical protein